MNDIDITSLHVDENNFQQQIAKVYNYNKRYDKRNLNYEEPEEQPKKVVSPEERLMKVLKDEVNTRRSVSECLDYIDKLNRRDGFCANQREFHYKLFIDKCLSAIFDTMNDGNFYNAFINDIVISILNDKNIMQRSARNTREGTKYKITNVTEYVAEHLNLNKDNEIHKYFLKLVDKFYKYYKKGEQDIAKEQTPLYSIFSQAQIDLQQELLDEDPETTISNFENHTIEELIEYNIYHTDKVEDPYSILELVHLVIYSDDTLQDIPGLTATADWKQVIYDYYNISQDENESYFDNDDEFEQLSSFFNQDGILKQGAELYDEARAQGATEGLSNGGKATKTNHKKAITLQRIDTGEKYSFDTMNECAEFLNTNRKSIQRLMKGQTKLAKEWKII